MSEYIKSINNHNIIIDSSSSSDSDYEGLDVTALFTKNNIYYGLGYDYLMYYRDFLYNQKRFNLYQPLLLDCLQNLCQQPQPQEDKAKQIVQPSPPQLPSQPPPQPSSKIVLNKDTKYYVRTIIETYNKMQENYVEMFNRVIGILQMEISQMEIIKYEMKDIPLDTYDNFIGFMKFLKSDIMRMTKDTEILYDKIKDYISDNERKQIDRYFEMVEKKTKLLIPSSLYKPTNINIALGKIFDIFDYSDLKKKKQTGGDIKNLNQVSDTIEKIKRQLNDYQMAIEKWDIARFKELSDVQRNSLMLDTQAEFEKEKLDPKRIDGDNFITLGHFTNITEKDIYQSLLDEQIEDYKMPDPEINAGNTTMDEIIKSVNDLNYEMPSTTEYMNHIIKMEKFVNYDYSDLTENDFTTTDEIKDTKLETIIETKKQKLSQIVNELLQSFTKIQTYREKYTTSIGLKGGNITDEINKYRLLIDTIYKKIHTGKIIKEMNSIELKNIAERLLKESENIIYFTLIILNDLIDQTKKDTVFINTSAYIDYKDIIKFNIDQSKYRDEIFQGVNIRIRNLIRRIRNIFDDKQPKYLIIDPNKKSFIPLILLLRLIKSN